jgi:RHS repeat-associated protein
LTEDALGSVRVIIDSNGQIKARRDFLPLGEEIYAGIGNRNVNQKYSANGDDTRKKFATYQRDAETNLDYAQSRYYSPMQGRFTSPDEFKGGPDELFDFEEDASDNPTFYADLTNPQSLNKYQYGYNNPYKYNDPTGHCVGVGTLARPLCIKVGEKIARALKPVAKTAGKTALVGVGVALEWFASGNTAGDGSCQGCTSSQQMGQSLMNESASSSGNAKATPATKAVDAKVSTSGSAGGNKNKSTSGSAGGNKNKKSGTNKQKKERSALGTQTQREDISVAQAKKRKRRQGEQIRSIEKSKQNEATELKRIKNLKDAEEKFKP